MGIITALKSLFGLKKNGDRSLICGDCGKTFIFDEGEQRFFKSKGFTDPKRCPRCRKRVKARLQRKSRNRHSGRFQEFRHRRSVIDGDSPYADE